MDRPADKSMLADSERALREDVVRMSSLGIGTVTLRIRG
jgi:hypothetical protein